MHVSTGQPDGAWWMWQDLGIILEPGFSSLGAKEFLAGMTFPSLHCSLSGHVTKIQPVECKKCDVFPGSGGHTLGPLSTLFLHPLLRT